MEDVCLDFSEPCMTDFHFVINETEEIRDLAKNGRKCPTFISGVLKFIKPHHHLEHMDSDLYRKLSTDVIAWFIKHFGRCSPDQQECVEQMLDHIVTYAMYTYPGASSYDKLVLHAIFHCWWWVIGDWIDTFEFEDPSKVMKAIIDGVTEPFKTMESMTFDDIESECAALILSDFLKAYQNFIERTESLIPDFQPKSKKFNQLMRKHFQMLEWAMADKHFYSYSETSFRNLRSLQGGLECTYEYLLILEDAQPPEDVVEHPMFQFLISLVSLINVNVNDIMGLKKDAVANDQDSCIVFKIKKLGIPIDTAVREATHQTNALVEDYVALRKKLVQQFGETLMKIIHILDAHEYGSLQFYGVSPRYLMNDMFGWRRGMIKIAQTEALHSEDGDVHL